MNNSNLSFIKITLLIICCVFVIIFINSLGCNYSLTIKTKDGYQYDGTCQLGQFSYLNESPYGELSTAQGVAFVIGSQVFHYVTKREIVKIAPQKDGILHNDLALYQHKVKTIHFFTYGFQRLSNDKVAVFEFPLQHIHLAHIKGHISMLDQFNIWLKNFK